MYRGPRVSVIIPTYNRPGMLRRAAASVLGQTYHDFELIIVDDCSGDETSAAVADITAGDTRARYYRHAKNRGTAATRNTGIRNARGEYIAFLDDDDEYLPPNLERQVAVLDAASPEVGLSYVWYTQVGPSGEVVRTVCRTHSGYVFDKAMAMGFSLTVGSAALFRREVFEVAGYFDESLRRSEDNEFQFRFARHFSIVPVPELLMRYDIGHPSKSNPYNITKQELANRRNNALRHQRNYAADLAANRYARAALWRHIAKIEWRMGSRARAALSFVRALVTHPDTGFLACWWLLRRLLGSRLQRLLAPKLRRFVAYKTRD